MFAELIDGARMEIDWTGCRDFDELIVYCRRGRHDRKALSFHLWTRQHGDVAIRRAVGNRSAANQYSARRSRGLLNGRIYLPRDELDRLGVRLRLDDTGALDDPDGRLAALLRFSADRAADWYSLGLRLIPHLDRRSAACCAAMSGIYRRQLALIRASPAVVYDRRISLSGLKKAQVAAAALASSVTCGPAHGPLPADLGSHPSH